MDDAVATAVVPPALPRWKCHKVVQADKIVSIRLLAPDEERAGEEDAGMRWILECGRVVMVRKEMVARKQPYVGDYFVIYDDAYEAWSPARIFLSGYRRLTEKADAVG